MALKGPIFQMEASMYRVLWANGEVWCDLQSRSETIKKVNQLRDEGVENVEVWQKQWVPITTHSLLHD
jgi:hypothetical protein